MITTAEKRLTQKEAIEFLRNSENTHGKDLHRAVILTKISLKTVREWEEFFNHEDYSTTLRAIEKNREIYSQTFDPFNLEILLGAERALRKSEVREEAA